MENHPAEFPNVETICDISTGPSLPVGLGAPAGLVSRLDQVLLFGGSIGGSIDGNVYTTEVHSLGENWEEGWAVEEVELNEGRGFNPFLVIHHTNMLNC